MDYPKLRIMTTGEDPNVNTPIAEITLPYPDNGGGKITPLMASSEEETLDYTRYKEITGAKLEYTLTFSFMTVPVYDSLLDNIVLNATSRDIYFKYDRWAQSSAWVKVIANLGDQEVENGLGDVTTDLYLTEVDSRI